MKAKGQQAPAKPRRGDKAQRGRKGGGKQMAAKGLAPASGRQLLLALALLLAVVASGLLLVRRADEARQLHGRLEAARKVQDQLLVEHSRLLLERGALSAHHNVERVAGAELGMRFPEQVEHLAP